MAIQPLAALPIPPLATDSEAVFNAKTDATLLAEKAFVDEMNAATIPGINQAVIDVTSAKDAAATSADNAADSVTLAEQQVDLAADQVGLAVTARQAAEAALASNVVVAAAVQSAAGMPSLASHGGQALCAKVDETGVEFKALGQAIGDVLVSARIAVDATYLLPDTIYTRAAYPELFAIVGTINSRNEGSNWTSVSNGAATPGSNFSDIKVGKDGVMIAVGANGQSTTGGLAVRSTDGGATWATIPTLHGLDSLLSVATDGNGTWITSSYNTFVRVYKSTNNGATWAQAPDAPNVGSQGTPYVYYGGGAFIRMAGTGTYPTFTKSLDAGVTWSASAIPTGLTVAVAKIAYDTVSATWFGLSSSALVSSKDSFATVTAVGYTAATGGTLTVNAGLIAFIQNGVINISTDGGNLFAPVKIAAPVSYVAIGPSGVILATISARLYRSIDSGESWQPLTTSIVNMNLGFSAVDANGNWVANGVSGNNFGRSAIQYNYDVSTQFKTPAHKAPKGYKAYIKGKLL